MTTLAFDGRTGASGDMLLGALVAVGADPAVLAPVEDALDVTYDVREVTRRGVSATKVTVRHGEASEDGRPRDHDDGGHDHAHGDGEGHHHSHDGDDHSHDEEGHDHGGAEGHGPSRSYAEVVEVVEAMELPDPVEADALATFELLGRAEAAVHGTDLEATHFHEVGADDAIADVVGVCLLLADLDPERVVTTPVFAGGGEVEMSHGVYPVPAPAVVELAERAGWRLVGGPVDTELLTPTGAALLAHLAEGVDETPALRVDASGYGAGTKDLPERPNVLRAALGAERADADARAGDATRAGHADESGLVRDDVVVLETNLDDATPEVLGGLQETLADAGARDVSVLPVTMKKSRPGHLVKVVAKPADASRVARRLAEETGTLGIRESSARHRWIAERTFETADLDIDGETYAVSVKVASDADGEVYDYSAEYDDAHAVARETGLPVREVLRRAVEAVR
ncbi:nickel pincer cofactor biosynthesis protein LarC [Halarchaeum sp. CBA1220]|uniref:nickel pincer cofactor biosynthesis protein LarC n=1 Tax=Halarchaeum sp. CBA1220 TaxID=1853682 RepID=UPI000F3A96C5|nr:nickel pincer cofactor biosynthesis protein LarC [Halarchaeum sp. CBA1220]QLC32942.1 nickel pincer cofactor biosynthesis protein LarC [Halarchaeum sp. CBA1220]